MNEERKHAGRYWWAMTSTHKIDCLLDECVTLKKALEEARGASLDNLQIEVNEWHERNFPGATPEDMLIGLTEELGELAHANLKGRQLGQDTIAQEYDAIGDMVIFLINYCNKRGFVLDEIIKTVWAEVKKRNYKALTPKEEKNYKSPLHYCPHGIKITETCVDCGRKADHTEKDKEEADACNEEYRRNGGKI